MQKIHLLIIDPQNDFCDSKGSLFVPGADLDMKQRLPVMIKRLGRKLDDIHVTLDSHHRFDIAHPIFWKDSAGKHPNPFTQINVKDVEDGKWTPCIPSLFKRTLEYLRNLEKNNRYPHLIWPEHCLIGGWGTSVVPELHAALLEWEGSGTDMVDFVTKGSNPYTEHFSGVKAEVPDPGDPSTQVNTRLISILEDEADVVLIAGEALSHCVANTVRDIANEFKDPQIVKKFVLLTDASSNVQGFDKYGSDFVQELTGKGMQVTTTVEFLK